MSSKLDLTAVVAVFVHEGRYFVYPFFWVPDEGLEKRDTVEADSYRKWIQSEDLKTCKGREILHDDIEEFVVKLRDEYGLDIREVICDPALVTQLRQRLESQKFVMVDFSQRNWAHWTEACLEFEAALEGGRIAHHDNPCLTWNASCVKVKRNGEFIRPVKPDRRKTKSRIDGIVGEIMPLKRAMVHTRIEPSIYDSPETAVM